LTKFTFPGVTDPRNGSNRSDWIEGVTLANKMITEDETITDKNTLTNMDYFTNGGFSLRAVVVPIAMGETLIWVGAAPGTPSWIKEETEKRGLNEYAPNIPTFGIKLVKKRKSNEAEGAMKPMEGDLVSKSWGMYPLIQVRSPEGNDGNNKLFLQKLGDGDLPESKHLWKEFCAALRAVDGHNSRTRPTVDKYWANDAPLDWPTKTIFVIPEADRWPKHKALKDLPAATATSTGKKSGKPLSVRGMKYSQRGGYTARVVGPGLQPELATALVEAANFHWHQQHGDHTRQFGAK
jgi:hypothetical protein